MRLITVLIVGFVIFGCATYSDWKPTVDSYNNPHASRIPQEMTETK